MTDTDIDREIERLVGRMAAFDPTLDPTAWRTHHGERRVAVSDTRGCYARIGDAKVSLPTPDDLAFWIAKETACEHVERRLASSERTPKDRIDFRQKHTRALLDAAHPGWGARPRAQWGPTSAEVVARAARRAVPLVGLAPVLEPEGAAAEGQAIEQIVSNVVALSVAGASPHAWRERGDGAIYVSVASGAYHVRYNGRDGNRHVATYATRDQIARALAREALAELDDLDRFEALYAQARPGWF